LLAAACIPAVYLVAHETLRLRTHALVATAFYAVLAVDPPVLFVGGGVARAPGMLLALVATWLGLRMIRQGRARNVIATGVAAGLAAMTHPEAAVFVAIGIGALVSQRHRQPGSMPWPPRSSRSSSCRHGW
jgi:4-amino-4-deoxy-L-arabinose transferase-like glycosyltransferase